jgi:2-amino-4-hydroxy-6-hydroxymethyldihydropteridine diphosphokinase
VTRIYLSAGSNIGDREAQLKEAIDRLRGTVDVRDVSPLYETDPVGVTDQPAFLNLAVSADTDLSPLDLLNAVKRIEWEIGRRPTFRWGPRVVDIDILLYGDEVVSEPDLAIPHPEMINRAFVLVPLADIAPRAIHPPTGKTIQGLRDEAPGLETVRRYQ